MPNIAICRTCPEAELAPVSPTWPELLYRAEPCAEQTNLPFIFFSTPRHLAFISETRHEISNNVLSATSKASDQLARTRSLIRAFASRLNILCTEQHLEFLSLKGACKGLSESTLVKTPHCWKSHVAAQIMVRMSYRTTYVPTATITFSV